MGRVSYSMIIIAEKMRHSALSAIAAATRCGGSGVSCRLQTRPRRRSGLLLSTAYFAQTRIQHITRSEINDYDAFCVKGYRIL